MVRSKSHEENRHVLCALCFSKSKTLRKITDAQKNIISEYFLSNFKICEADYPDRLCVTCRVVCNQYGAGNFARKINLHIYSHKSSTFTRSNKICCCEVCEAARLSINKIRIKRGRPKMDITKSKDVKRICNNCLSEVGKGRQHFCNVSKRISNLSNLLEDNSSASRPGEAVVSSFLHSKTTESGSSTIQLRNRRGKPTVFEKNR